MQIPCGCVHTRTGFFFMLYSTGFNFFNIFSSFRDDPSRIKKLDGLCQDLGILAFHEERPRFRERDLHGIPSIFFGQSPESRRFRTRIEIGLDFDLDEIGRLLLEADAEGMKTIPLCWLDETGRLLAELTAIDKSDSIRESLREQIAKTANPIGLRYFLRPTLIERTPQGADIHSFTVIAIFGSIMYKGARFLLSFDAFESDKNRTLRNTCHYPSVKFPFRAFEKNEGLPRYANEPAYVCLGGLQRHFGEMICKKRIAEASELLRLFLLTRK